MFKDLNTRDTFEKWLDKHNHKFELIRTVAGIISAIGGTAAILRVMGLI